MNTIYYILEANVYLIAFYGFYLLLLKKETFYTLNRVYFLIIPLLAFILPNFRLSGLHPEEMGVQYLLPSIRMRTEESNPYSSYLTWTLLFYCSIVIVLCIRLVLRLHAITNLIRNGTHQQDGGVTMVNLNDSQLSFSFLNYLFLQSDNQKTETIIRHEKVHIEQLHSLDVLFYEIISIFNWFNPVILFMQKEIKAIHEFIADEATSAHEDSASDYALFLIKNSFGEVQNKIIHPIFSKSLLKQRIMKLDQKKSSGAAKLKYALLLLMLPLMVLISASAFKKPYGSFELMPELSVIKSDTIDKGSQYLWFLNGKRFYGSKDSDYAVQGTGKPLTIKEAINKYGISGTRGIFDIKGKIRATGLRKDKLPDSLAWSPPPPPPPMPSKKSMKPDIVRFPPSAVNGVKKMGSQSKSSRQKMQPPPPPPEPPKPKVDKIKFPPPVVKPTRKVDAESNSDKIAPPPPPEPPKSKKDPISVPSKKKGSEVKEVIKEPIRIDGKEDIPVNIE